MYGMLLQMQSKKNIVKPINKKKILKKNRKFNRSLYEKKNNIKRKTIKKNIIKKNIIKNIKKINIKNKCIPNNEHHEQEHFYEHGHKYNHGHKQTYNSDCCYDSSSDECVENEKKYVSYDELEKMKKDIIDVVGSYYVKKNELNRYKPLLCNNYVTKVDLDELKLCIENKFLVENDLKKFKENVIDKNFVSNGQMDIINSLISNSTYVTFDDLSEMKTLVINNIKSLLLASNTSFINIMKEYVNEKIEELSGNGCSSNNNNNDNTNTITSIDTCDFVLPQYKIDNFYYYLNPYNSFDINGRIMYEYLKSTIPDRISIISDTFDIQTILNTFDESVINTLQMDTCNFECINNHLSTVNKKLIQITDRSTVYLTILKEAAGYDNCLGFYNLDINSSNTINSIEDIDKVILFPSIKRLNCHQIKLGCFKDKKLGFFIVSDGNNCDPPKFVDPNRKIFLTNYELNNIDEGDVESPYNKVRHIYVEQTIQTSPYVKHYILLFEDLPFSLYTNDGTYNSVLGFNNVQLIITVIQNDQQTITATLV